MKYPGGKSYLAKKIVGLMAPHTRYVETHFGGGSVLFAKFPEGVSEYVNDLDRDLANFWQCLRSKGFDYIRDWLEFTPVSREEFEQANPDRLREIIGEFDLYRAYKFFIRNRQSRQGLGKDFCTPTSRTRRGMNENVSAWLSAVDGLPEVHARLRRVEIRNQDAINLIGELDSPDTLFYLDPPYHHETRVTRSEYGNYEMDDFDHRNLLGRLSVIQGKFLLSGYRNATYDEHAENLGWHRVDFQIDNKASSKKTKPIKTECVWANYEISAA